jgi:hypothetical protein
MRVPGGWSSQISWQSAHEGGKVVSPTHRPPLPPRYSFLLEAESAPGATVRPEWLRMSMKNSSDTIGNQTRDLPTCSAVPQPTALRRAPMKTYRGIKYSFPSFFNFDTNRILGQLHDPAALLLGRNLCTHSVRDCMVSRNGSDDVASYILYFSSVSTFWHVFYWQLNWGVCWQKLTGSQK